VAACETLSQRAACKRALSSDIVETCRTGNYFKGFPYSSAEISNSECLLLFITQRLHRLIMFDDLPDNWRRRDVYVFGAVPPDRLCNVAVVTAALSRAPSDQRARAQQHYQVRPKFA